MGDLIDAMAVYAEDGKPNRGFYYAMKSMSRLDLVSDSSADAPPVFKISFVGIPAESDEPEDFDE